jgi:hypothetical protein
VRLFQKRNDHLDPEVVKNLLKLLESFRYAVPYVTCNSNSFQGGGDGRGYRNMYKISRGSIFDLSHLFMYVFIYVRFMLCVQSGGNVYAVCMYSSSMYAHIMRYYRLCDTVLILQYRYNTAAGLDQVPGPFRRSWDNTRGTVL